MPESIKRARIAEGQSCCNSAYTCMALISSVIRDRSHHIRQTKIMYKLTDFVPYLLNRSGVGIAEVFSQKIAEDNLTVAMYRVLAMLKERRESTLGDLADVVSVEVSTLSRLVGTLPSENW